MPVHIKAGNYGNLDPAVQQLAEEQPELVESIFQDWLSKERGIARMFPEQRGPGRVCEFVPRDFNGYIRHVVEMMQAENATFSRWSNLQEEYAQVWDPSWPSLIPFWGARFGETRNQGVDMNTVSGSNPNHPLRTPVLSLLSQWQAWGPPFGVPWRHYVDWPSPEEMSWEGDQRVASENGRYGRFPALPRRSDYSGHITWQTREYVKPWPFDDVWKVPQMDDIFLPAEQIEEPEIISRLLNNDLLDAIDSSDVPIGTGKIYFRLGIIPWQP